jgi:protein PhnA
MTLEDNLKARSDTKCELCSDPDNLTVYEIPPDSNGTIDATILICQTCQNQIENPDQVDVHHWRCLNDSMWNTVPAVQVMAWRMLKRLSAESWAQDLLDMLYLDDEILSWAQASGDTDEEGGAVIHMDSNGAVLNAGDTVTLVKDLNVKGAGFTAKRGTAVRGISLVHDNPAQIEGRVNGQQIVILTEFVKKSG